MYASKPFELERRETLFELIEAFPLAVLVAPDGAGFVDADLVPMALDRAAMRLRAHVARQNPLVDKLADGPQKLLAVFLGPQAYVSPSHYPSKAAHGRVVPTWNYAMVQAEGLARLMDERQLAAQLDALTTAQEAGREKPWRVADAPADYLAKQMQAIRGVEIAISSLRGKFKLSQNRTDADAEGVIAGLAAEESPTARRMAAFMSAQRSNGT